MARQSSNPALNRIPAFSGPASGSSYADPLEQSYASPPAGGLHTGRMTVEDVTVRTAVLLGIALVAGAATWVLNLEALALPAAIVGLVLGLVIAFKQITKPAVIIAYAAIEGVFLGGISKLFEGSYPGIVVQAVVGTVAVAAAVLALYRSGAIKVTPRFQKMVIAATLGFFALMLVNFAASFFMDGGFGLRSGGLGIVVGLFAIGLASMNLILDLDLIEKGAAAGVPERYGWLAAFGLMVTLVWLYIEILRLLSIFRD